MSLTALILGLIALCTSTLTGIFGMGGGLLLLGFMPAFLPIAAVIPVHGVTQLVSNTSRAYFSWRAIRWKIMPPFLLGGVIGTVCFALLLKVISLNYLPLFIGGYILLSQWSNLFNRMVERFESFTILGFFQVGLALLTGTIGPVHMVLLNKHYTDRHQIVATAAAMMSIKHGLKVIAFILIGVKLLDFLDVVIAMTIAAVIGSYIGTKLRAKTNNKNFKLILKIILSLLAIKMIVEFLI